MTVAELIEGLQELPSGLQVTYKDGSCHLFVNKVGLEMSEFTTRTGEPVEIVALG